MMGLIGQGCEHGDVLEVTGTNTPTQKNTHLLCGQLRRAVMRQEQVFAAKRRMIIVFVFVVQCLTQHAARTLLGCGGGLFQRFVLVVLASRVRPVPFRSR